MFGTILCCFYTWISTTSHTKLCKEINVQYYKEYFVWSAYYLFLSSLFLSEMLYEQAWRPWGESHTAGVCTLLERCWIKLLKPKPTPCSANLLWPQTTPLTHAGITKYQQKSFGAPQSSDIGGPWGELWTGKLQRAEPVLCSSVWLFSLITIWSSGPKIQTNSLFLS